MTGNDLMVFFERHLLLVFVTGAVSLLVLLVLKMLRVDPRNRARVVAQVPNVLFGAAVLAIVGFGLYFS
ncbi:hypothetical protein E7V67_019070 [[Empedobacter] haloabium]|uniref:Uncharacterized protein n=2 Tax=Telluria group TaxID=2895353 RepID=A0ABZ1UHS1_9BURK